MINADNKSKLIKNSPDGRRYGLFPNGDRIRTTFAQSLGSGFSSGRVDVVAGAEAQSLTITGTGFGTGPTVVLFHRMDGTEGATVGNSDPEIGAWVGNGFNASANPAYTLHDGRLRLDTAGLSSVYGMRSKRITFSATQQFRVAFRVGVPTGYEWPAGTPTGGPLNGTSHSKFAWFGNSGYSNDGTLSADDCSDIIAGSMIGASCNVTGNSITLASGKRSMMTATTADQLVPGVYALLSYYQEPVPGDIYNVNGTTHRFTSVEGGALENNSVICSPYGSSSNIENNYDVLNIPGYHGNDSGAEVRVAYTDMYLATGANSGKCIVLHDASTLSASTVCYIVPPDSWSNTSITTIPLVTRERQPYYTVIDGTGAALASGSTGY
jgi:hypothetical protein